MKGSTEAMTRFCPAPPPPFLRYPGGKQRHVPEFAYLLPRPTKIKRFIEPFVGGGAVFFYIQPRRAFLADLNDELIDLYRAIKESPIRVWNRYWSFSATKSAFYKIRAWDVNELDLWTRAARTLYLNRTCFKGMWRHNLEGGFNVGFGGEDRRSTTARRDLIAISNRLQQATIKCWDFERTIDRANEGDFVFLDPPYRPGESEILHEHYRFGKFLIEDHERLAKALRRASRRGVKWAMTMSSHEDCLGLYTYKDAFALPKGTSARVGTRTRNSRELLIRNYKRVPT